VIAHVDAEGTVCFADTTNILIDAQNPEGLIQDALARATNILAAGDASATSIAEEFQAYWGGQDRLCCLCTVDDLPREVVVTKRSTPKPWYIAADSKEALLEWTTNRRMAPSTAFLPGCVVPFQGPPLSLLQREHLLLRHVCGVLRELVPPQAHQLLMDMLSVHLGAVVLFTFPIGSARLRGAGALILRSRKVVSGFRPGKISRTDFLRASLAEPVTKVNVERADAEYLLLRGGALTTARHINALVLALELWVAGLPNCLPPPALADSESSTTTR
jgi:hypothetical protein